MQTLPVYVINLDRRPDRWIRCQKEFDVGGLKNITRVSAIDGKMIDPKQIEVLTGPKVYERLGKLRHSDEELGTVGAIGCYLSHMKVWQMIHDAGTPALIMEDDVFVQKDYVSMWPTLEQLKAFDFVNFGAFGVRSIPSSSEPGLVEYKGNFMGLQFYYLTPEAAGFFLNGALPITQQVDWYMSAKLKNIPSIRAAIHVPKLATQHRTSTDIQSPVIAMSSTFKNGWFITWVGSVIIFIIIALLLWRKRCQRNR